MVLTPHEHFSSMMHGCSVTLNLLGSVMRDYNIFISHSWSYSGHYNRLIQLLKEASYFHFKDFSIPKDDPIHDAPTDVKLAEAIRKQMLHASVVVVTAGVYATYSKWVEKEIQIAKRGAKKILAIKLWDSERASSLGDE